MRSVIHIYEVFKMNKAAKIILKYIKYDVEITSNYDEALELTCKIEKSYFKDHGHIMSNELFDEVFDLIYAA